jgi:hypothetical protein
MVAAAQRGGMKIFSSLSKPKWHLPIDVSNPIMAGESCWVFFK